MNKNIRWRWNSEIKSGGYYKEEIKPGRLRKFIDTFKIIEVMPLKGNKPKKDPEAIFILKGGTHNYTVYGHKVGKDSKIIIHNGNFIWANDTKVITCGVITSGKKGKSEVISDEYAAYEGYLDKLKKYPSKEFSIKTILDEKIQLQIKKSKKSKKNDKSKIGYLKLIRGFLKKNKVMKESRGKRFVDFIRERNQVIINKYKELRSEGIIKQYVIIAKIREALDEYAERIKSSDRPKEAAIINKVFMIKDTQIRRIIQKFHKK